MRLPVLYHYFEGYDVPEKYKWIASCIMRRFDITGSSDGMYICNCIAYDSGTGDGRGNFTGDAVNIDKCASFLQRAYGCNIYPSDLPELREILCTGKLDEQKTIHGLREYIKRMRKEKPLEQGGRYTRRYILRCIHNAADTIDEINGTLPTGYIPDYYNPGYIRNSEDDYLRRTE